MLPSLSVIIPVFNEEKTITKVLKKVIKQKETSEIIVVDDGSSDNSIAVITNFSRENPKIPIILIKHRKNKGKGQAIINGIKKAKCKLIIIQDADLEYNPSDYPKLLQPILDEKTDFVLGNRWEGNRRGYLLAQLGNLYMTYLTNVLYFKKYKDTYTGYKVGSRKIWKRLNLTSSKFEIEAEITAKLAILGYKTMDVPIKYNPRTFKQGKKIHWQDVVKGTLTLIKLRF